MVSAFVNHRLGYPENHTFSNRPVPIGWRPHLRIVFLVDRTMYQRRLRAVAVALTVLCVVGTASAQFATCDDEYECIYESSTVDGITFSFDLRPLCEQGTTYTAQDDSGHSYSFNICGTSSFECVPGWTNVYETGVAVQYWGSAPPCNATTPNCTDFRGDNVCCTQNCQVLGVGIPNWQLKNPSNPEFGGLTITHIGVPPACVPDGDFMARACVRLSLWCGWTGLISEHGQLRVRDFVCVVLPPFVRRDCVIALREAAPFVSLFACHVRCVQVSGCHCIRSPAPAHVCVCHAVMTTHSGARGTPTLAPCTNAPSRMTSPVTCPCRSVQVRFWWALYHNLCSDS